MPVVLHKQSLVKIPTELNALINERHVLSSEDPKQYDSLLQMLADTFQPRTPLQWLDVKQLQDLLWDQQRMSRIKPAIIDTAQGEAVRALMALLKDPDVVELDSCKTNQDTRDWFTNPQAREKLTLELAKFNLTQNSIDAMAFVRRVHVLEIVEKLQMSNDIRQTELLRRLQHVHAAIECREETARVV